MTKGSSTRGILVCIFCFVASCLVTWSVRSSFHNTRFGPSLRHQKLGTGQQLPTNGPKVAYATLLAANQDPDAHDDFGKDGYFLGVRLLAYQLLHSQSAGTNHSIPLIVMCTKGVSKRKRDRLEKDGATVIVVNKLKSDMGQSADEKLVEVMTKLHLFEMVEYNKICFIDADTLITANLDGVFYDEATLTQPTLTDLAEVKADEGPLPRTYMFATHADFWGYDHPYPPPTDSVYLNCGFSVFTPSKRLYSYYTSLLQLPGRFGPSFPEQDLFNYAHRRDGNMPWKPLWYGWNVNWPTENDWKGGAKSFHAKFWDGDAGHDPVLKQLWERQRSEMEGFYRGREIGEGRN
ncbi:glycosyltransferase family 8 protein [Polychaeton citri CBS 116435]|uniref:Glycosyltransferase family 8 protein n=1 Tax=Polychaeton citri CBS 116435 TaxID=1314669 RepID=A0A9P4UUG1_9PEZI|nr:glycosyltransferase family 8 protein [Polychaeton citri CBS 116435]